MAMHHILWDCAIAVHDTWIIKRTNRCVANAPLLKSEGLKVLVKPFFNDLVSPAIVTSTRTVQR